MHKTLKKLAMHNDNRTNRGGLQIEISLSNKEKFEEFQTLHCAFAGLAFCFITNPIWTVFLFVLCKGLDFDILQI
jgi:hypothetical protein